jgi:predicted AlkP superfamily phosphohydrolase/phosphomutase
MKLLMIGMDGAHEGVFKRGWTPFITSLSEKQVSLDLSNDLLSRGWLEIATGKHASETGAMYDMPQSDMSYKWKADFSINDIANLGSDVKPIWQKLSEEGVKVGIMNLPTTFPAPKVNGFFVSGGGGGAPVTQSPTPELCYPHDTVKQLKELDYIVDDRLYQLMVDKGLKTPSEILDRLSYKNDRRTEGFLELDRKFNVDFGFVVYKTSSVITETMFNAELKRQDNPKNNPDKELLVAVQEYYRKFDKSIEKLVSSYPEAEIVFVSDHGTCKREFSINFNVFLRDNGYQKTDFRKLAIKLLVSKAKEIVPFWLKAILKKSSAMKAKHVGQISFNPKTSIAFSKTQGDWSHGIYINDENRFGGIVKTENIDSIRDEIINKFNMNAMAKKHGLKAFKNPALQGSDVNYFPDICIDIKNGYLTTDKTSKFIEEFISPEIDSAISAITRGDVLSVKSHSPLALVFSECLNNLEFKTGGDLTRVYDYILKRFK